MKRALRRWVHVLSACVLTVVIAAVAPHLLRRAPAFRVLDVEVVGARLMSAARVVETAGISATSSVFDDTRAWRAALLTDPLIADARITRRVPSTVRIAIDEVEPVAFASLPELVAVDATGRALAIEREALVDLPVIVVTGELDGTGTLADEPSRTLLAIVERLREHEPWLLDWVSALDMTESGDVKLVLRWPSAYVLLRPDVEPARLADVRLVLADLAAQPLAAGAEAAGVPPALADSELGGLMRLDARYSDQVVVALEPGSGHRSSEAN